MGTLEICIVHWADACDPDAGLAGFAERLGLGNPAWSSEHKEPVKYE